MEDGDQSKTGSSFLTLFPAPAWKSSMSLQSFRRTYSSLLVTHGLQCSHPLDRGLSQNFQGLYEKLYFRVWGTFSPPPSLTLGFAVFFLALFLPSLLTACLMLCPSLNITEEVSPAQLRDSAVPCSGSVGTGWNWLCQAWDSPSLSSQKLSLQHPTLPQNLDIYTIYIQYMTQSKSATDDSTKSHQPVLTSKFQSN